MSDSSPNITDLLDNDNAPVAQKILDYYDGDQQKHFVKMLNDPNMGRKEWRTRGLIPRTRNILKMVIDKSGLLFNDKAPVLNVFRSESSSDIDEELSTKFLKELEKTDWIEFFTNFDSVVRMLKTACLLVQYDEETDGLTFDILGQHNAAVVQNPNNKLINTLVYRTNGVEAETGIFRVYTKDLIQDLSVNPQGQVTILNEVDNPFGVIPVVAFHDTNIPRIDFWNKIPTDLINVNDIYNFHITDSEYAASWAKLQTLFTNARIANQDDMQFQSMEVYGSPLPRQAPAASSLMGGPSSVVQIDTTGVDTPFVEYKGPVVDLQPIDNMVNKWVADYAMDWSVTIDLAGIGGSGSANSGFQLMVEELPNLELRKKRQKMFQAGIKRLYKMIVTVLNTAKPGYFPEDAELDVTFSDPVLPVADTNMQEQTWSRRIQEGRASRVDYFMQLYGMSKSDALQKITEVDQENTPAGVGNGIVNTVQQYSMNLSNPKQVKKEIVPAETKDTKQPGQFPDQSNPVKPLNPNKNQEL